MRQAYLTTLAFLGPVAVGAMACARPASPPAPAAPAAVAVQAPATHAAHAAPAPSGPVSARLAAGEQVVTTVCAGCHTLQPPHKTAPPLAMVSRRYRRATADSAAAIERIVAWVRAPAAERSLMPAMAIERFGLMPALPLPDSTLRAAAAYVLSLSAPGGGHHGAGGRMMRPSRP